MSSSPGRNNREASDANDRLRPPFDVIVFSHSSRELHSVTAFRTYARLHSIIVGLIFRISYLTNQQMDDKIVFFLQTLLVAVCCMPVIQYPVCNVMQCKYGSVQKFSFDVSNANKISNGRPSYT